MAEDERNSQGWTRRRLLAAGGGIGAGTVFGAGRLLDDGGRAAVAAPVQAVPFFGEHQAGIATPQQKYLQFGAFDVTAVDVGEVAGLFERWTEAAGRLTSGKQLTQAAANDPGAPADTGEAAGRGPARLTITFGLGPGLFGGEARDRFVLRARKPAALTPLPPFPNDELSAERSDGDLAIQVCADDPQVAFHAIHNLARIAHGTATIRWLQAGFTAGSGPRRNLLGFKDGTNNIRADDKRTLAEHVWISPATEPWLQGGTYMVVRRIRMLLDVWDATSLKAQEAVIGRRKGSGALVTDAPRDAHVRLAAPESNRGTRLLRRSYSYSDGVDPDTGQIDAGLVFVAFQRDPHQFVRVQRALAAQDALRKHLSHTGSAIFAVPRGVAQGETIASELFA